MSVVGTSNVIARRHNARSTIARRVVVAAAGTVVASAMLVPLASTAQALPAGCNLQNNTTVDCLYSAGVDTTFTVPAGVTSLDLAAVGGAGADGLATEAGSQTPGIGGEGGLVGLSNYASTPGSVLNVYVGGNGSGTQGGANGGGNGGTPYPSPALGCNSGGGGGGASSVQLNGNAIIAAAGGGGGGGAFTETGNPPPGAGGAAGQNGQVAFNSPPGSSNAGSAGSAAGPGAAGLGNGGPTAGMGGVGGTGGYCGGGGGGGVYGGGGGAVTSGGGGGYSYGGDLQSLSGGNETPTVEITYNATAAPTITSFTPTSGLPAGGTVVTVNGTNFTGVTDVKFADNDGTGLNVISPTQLRITSPAGTGSGFISVVTPGGVATSPTTFTYEAATPAPTITGFTPASGPTTGGTVVTITGTNLSGAAVAGGGVKFATTPGTGVTAISPTELQVTSPPGTGSVALTVSAGTGFATSATNFTYTVANPDAPTITSFTPTSGPPAGGTVVTVTGTNLTGATSVDFGATPGTALNVTSPTQLQVTSPAGVGAAPLTVTAGGQTTTSLTNFAYTPANPNAPTITGFTPTSGPEAGGTVVTVTGTNLTGATSVAFGTTPGIALTVTSPTQLQVTSPAGPGLGDVPAAAVPITVTVNGQTATAPTTFTYTTGPQDGLAPTITASISSEFASSHGWYSSPVTVSFSCHAGAAPLSGACPDPITLSANGKGQSVSKTITDTDGHTATATVSGINIDQVAPVVHVTGATTGKTYPSRQHLTCHASDSLSGVASCVIHEHVDVSNGVRTLLWNAIAKDNAGNVKKQHGHYVIG